MWWTKDNKRPYKGFEHWMPITEDLWQTYGGNEKMPFLRPEIAVWCKEHGVEFFLEKLPVKGSHPVSEQTGLEWVKCLNSHEIGRIARSRLSVYDVYITFKNKDDATLFKMTWC